MKETDGEKGSKGGTGSIKRVEVKARIGSQGTARAALSRHEQYADLALAVTLQDLADSNQTLDLNERPAFSQNPANVVRLFPEESKERLITHVLEQYGGS